jgi:hypothetical protein
VNQFEALGFGDGYRSLENLPGEGAGCDVSVNLAKPCVFES